MRQGPPRLLPLEQTIRRPLLPSPNRPPLEIIPENALPTRNLRALLVCPDRDTRIPKCKIPAVPSYPPGLFRQKGLLEKVRPDPVKHLLVRVRLLRTFPNMLPRLLHRGQ